MPCLCRFYPGICLTTEKKQGKRTRDEIQTMVSANKNESKSLVLLQVNCRSIYKSIYSDLSSYRQFFVTAPILGLTTNQSIPFGYLLQLLVLGHQAIFKPPNYFMFLRNHWCYMSPLASSTCLLILGSSEAIITARWAQSPDNTR